jgi:hypothetical protein
VLESDSIESPGQHRNLKDKNRSGCNADRKQRLRDPDGECFVCHVPSPLVAEIAPPANA